MENLLTMEIQGKRLQMAISIVFISLLITFSNCNGGTNPDHSQVIKNQLAVHKLDTLKNQFDRFINSVIEGEKNDVKVFFDFPIKSDDLWYKVLDDTAVENHLGTFLNEKDFEDYFDKIFTTSLKECLSAIDVKQLFDNGKFTTEPFTSKENGYLVENQIEATYSNNEVRLVFNSIVQDNENELNAEHAEIYIFNVVENRLKLSSFYMAG